MKTKIAKWEVEDDVSSNGHYSVLDEDGWRIAWVKDREDASLIAAAPELAWALENAITELRFHNVDQEGDQMKNTTIDILMPRLVEVLKKIK